jgi:hypothetical protein
VTESKHPDRDEGLVEAQGLNVGPPVDEEVSPGPDEDPRDEPRNGSRDAGPTPPDELAVPGALSDEMVGLPEQKPGYPGQQRSMDTS